MGKGDYVPEHVVYLLAMKANNETAKTFQLKIATEILPSIRRYGYYSVNHAAQTSLFPDEEQPVKKIRRPLPEVAVVYIILLANGLVKIGYSSDFNRRLKEIRKETKLEVVDFFTTNFMSLEEARKLEATLKAKFFDYLVSGEFFNVDFQTLKAALGGESKVNKLLEIAREMEPCPEKNSLLLQAAHALQ